VDAYDDVPRLLRCRGRRSDGIACDFEVVNNEATIEFKHGITAPSIRALLSCFGLKVLFADFLSEPGGDAASSSWFHVRVDPSSKYFNNVHCLIDDLAQQEEVANATYNDVAYTCGAPLPNNGYPGVASWQFTSNPAAIEMFGSAPAGAGDYYQFPNAQSRLRLGPSAGLSNLNTSDGAWYSAIADLENVGGSEVCVVIMDTGIDVDHPAFGSRTKASPADDYEGNIWTERKLVPVGGSKVARVVRTRVGMSASGGAGLKGDFIGSWMPEMPQPTVECNQLNSWKAQGNCPSGHEELQRTPSSPRLNLQGLPGQQYVVDRYKDDRAQEHNSEPCVVKFQARLGVPMQSGVDRDPPDPELCSAQTPEQWRVCSNSANDVCCGIRPDPLKHIDLRYRGHGHGTAAAGIVGARGRNGDATIGFGARHVKVMSAELRMVGDHRVDLASAIKCVVRLRRRHPAASGVKVVYMGFSVDASELDRRSALYALRGEMIKDAKGNDRLWIAPAGFSASGAVLSYPAAILWDKVGSAAPIKLKVGEVLPTVLGVSSVQWVNGSVSSDILTNYFTRDGRLDRRIYGVSGASAALVTTDVREAWYGRRWHYDRRRGNKYWRDQQWRDGVCASSTIRHGMRDLLGYAQDGGLTGPLGGPRSHGTVGFQVRGENDTFGLSGGGYYLSLSGESAGGYAGATSLFTGTSVAAAQIAALAGVLFSKHESANARAIASHIALSQQTSASGLIRGEESDGAFGYYVPGPRGAGRVAAPVDFLWALSNPPGTTRNL
jgi:subtilisin family serine protease